jgi:Zn-dependent M28 family amino/carboxypeptidase
VTSPNIVVVLGRSDPRLRNEYVIYTAHVDHLGIGEPANGDAIYNGAVDNASGTACLIEIARAFTRLELRPRRSIIVLTPTAEEKRVVRLRLFC